MSLRYRGTCLPARRHYSRSTANARSSSWPPMSVTVLPATELPVGAPRGLSVASLVAPATLFVAIGLLIPIAILFRYSLNAFVPGKFMVEAGKARNWQWPRRIVAHPIRVQGVGVGDSRAKGGTVVIVRCRSHSCRLSPSGRDCRGSVRRRVLPCSRCRHWSPPDGRCDPARHQQRKPPARWSPLHCRCDPSG